jgi:3-hydroxybutyrate dehydrogenase
MMKARNWGRIINMASIHATKVVKDRIDYMTTKAAIVGLTRAVALECAATGITCNAISPGWVLTPHAEGQIARQMAEKANARTGDPRAGRHSPAEPPAHHAAEVAALGVFLCGDGAANISGGLLPIDGAWATT